MKKTLLTAISAVSCLVAFPALALDVPGNFTANVGFTTEYSFRGLQQSDEGPAVQGGIDYSHESGFYAGVWGSNVDFNDGDQATLEADLYAGFTGETGGLTWDVGGIYYAYPGADTAREYDFFEIAASVGHDFGFASASAAVNYSPDFYNESGDAWYTALYADVPLPYDFKLSGSLGHQTIDNNTAFGFKDYTDWSLGLGYNLEGFDLALKYVDTSLDEPGECADGCDSRVIFSVTKAFQ